MPTRYLKPGIRDSAAIDKLSPMAECLYYRLLVTVDDFGRFDARPAMVKSHCFPVKEIALQAVEFLLEDLVNAGMLICYSVDGKPYLQVTKWENKARSQVSKYPQPPEIVNIPPTTVCTPPTVLPGTGTGTGTVLDPTGLVASADAEAPAAQVVKLADRRIPCPAEKLLEAFHAECPTLPRVMKLNDRRRQHLTTRWREVDADSKFQNAEDGIEVFRGIFRKVNASDFLAGRAKSWHATFDWLTESSTNFLKVCEGHYDNDRRAAK